MENNYDKKNILSFLDTFTPDNADLLETLHIIQEHFGYLSKEALEVVSELLSLSVAHVYGTATYYADFRFVPPPDTIIGWCSGPACLLKNGVGIRDAMLAEFETELGEQRENPSVEVCMAQCNGTCEQAPQIWLNDKVLGKLTVVQAIELARSIKEGN
ncbi:MAG: NAD(P)H-dependent oxidoreductase subunit E [Dehalococcoidia bacterium]|tara:strand:- start:350 stop:823 length:474 start_codon:yes stop_codon:yes gene_type:complete